MKRGKLVPFLALLVSLPAGAAIQASSDISITGSQTTLNLKFRQSLFFGGKSFSLGPALLVEHPQADLIDGIFGGGIHFGDPFFFRLDAGFFFRRLIAFDGIKNGRGIGLIPTIGVRWKWIRISLPITIKRTMSGLSPRWDIEVIPYLGVQMVIKRIALIALLLSTESTLAAKFEFSLGGTLALEARKPDTAPLQAGSSGLLYNTLMTRLSGSALSIGAFSFIEFSNHIEPMFGGALRFGRNYFIEGGGGILFSGSLTSFGAYGQIGMRVFSNGFVSFFIAFRDQAVRSTLFGPSVGWRFPF